MSAVIGFLIGYATGFVTATIALLLIQAREAKMRRYTKNGE